MDPCTPGPSGDALDRPCPQPNAGLSIAVNRNGNSGVVIQRRIANPGHGDGELYVSAALDVGAVFEPARVDCDLDAG